MKRRKARRERAQLIKDLRQEHGGDGIVIQYIHFLADAILKEKRKARKAAA